MIQQKEMLDSLICFAVSMCVFILTRMDREMRRAVNATNFYFFILFFVWALILAFLRVYFEISIDIKYLCVAFASSQNWRVRPGYVCQKIDLT